MKLSLRNGLFFGLVIGVASAFLYAPKAGKELREELKDKTDSICQHFLNLLESLVDLSVSILDFVKDAVKEQSEKVTHAVACGITAAKEKTEELKKFTANAAPR